MTRHTINMIDFDGREFTITLAQDGNKRLESVTSVTNGVAEMFFRVSFGNEAYHHNHLDVAINLYNDLP